MPINIGATGTTGRIIGGNEIYRDSNLELYLDPYRFECYGDTGSSTLYDLSGNNNDFTLANDADREDPITGDLPGHLYLDGTNDFLYRTDDSDFDIGTNDFTIQMWIRLTTTNTNYIFNKWYPFSGYSMVFFSGSMRCRMNNVYVNLDSVKTWTGNWVNVAWTCDRDGSTKLYHNGVLADTDYGTIVTSDISTSYYSYMGGYGSTSTTSVTNDMSGYVGPVLFYNGTALTIDQINQNFNVHRGIYGI